MAKMYLKKKILQNNFIFTYAFHKKMTVQNTTGS